MQMCFHRVLLLSLIIPLGLTACGGSGSSSTVDGKVNVDSASVIVPAAVSAVAIQVTEESGNPASNVAVSIRNGKDTDFTLSTNPYTTNDKGVIIIELPNDTNTGQLVASVTDDKYFSATKIIEISSTEQQETFVLTRREAKTIPDPDNANGTPAIVSSIDLPMTQKDSVTVDGVLINNAKTVEIKSSAAGSDNTTVAEVILPQGVAAKKEDGTAAVGQLKIDAVVYKNSTDASIAAFPGGLDIGNNITNDSDSPATIASPDADDQGAADSDSIGFLTAGFVALEVTDEAGNKITRFEGSNGLREGLVITTLVPKSTRYPGRDDSNITDETEGNLKIGDTIPIWSYESDNGQWTYQGDAKIYESADDNNWRAQFSANHLTFWNMDYKVNYCTNLSNTNYFIEFKDTAQGSLITRPLRVEFKRLGNGYAWSGTVSDGYIQGNRWPRFKLLLKVTDLISGKELQISSINNVNAYNTRRGYNFCSNQRSNDVYLDTSALQPISYKDVNIKVTTSCSNAALNAANNMPQNIPSSYVQIYQSSPYYFRSKITNTDGIASFPNLMSSGSYQLYVYNRINYTWITRTITPDQADPYVVDIKQTCPTVTTGTGGSSS